MNSNNIVTVGADPELFLRTISGKMISAVGLIGGTKHAPKPLDKPGCAVQEDNVSAEFNIPPAMDYEQFRESINYVLDYLGNRAQEVGLLLAGKVASHSFDTDQLESWQSQVFGCEPDMNAWTGRENPRPKTTDQNLRSCGGHIHVGTGDLSPADIIRSMDLHLGIPSLILDSDTQRRKLYGKAGAFRRKPYGVEYRTLSNFWIWSDDLIRWAWDGTQRAVSFVQEGKQIPQVIGKSIQEAINESNPTARDRCLGYLNTIYG